MGIDCEVSRLYDAAIHKAASGPEQWMIVCKLAGQLYRYEFDNILMVYMQRPKAALVADYDTWKKVGRYVKRGSKGIAIFPSRALRLEMRHVFDISDTGGAKRELTWQLDEKNRENYAAYLKREYGEPGKEILGERQKESAIDFLKSFTENRIGVIMDSEFGERITGLADIAGTKRIMVDDETQEVTAGEAVKRSVMYAVFTRCGFDISPEKQDFSFITAFISEEEIYRLGSLVSDISCEVLRNIAKELKQMKERSIAYGRDSIDILYRNGRDALPQSENAGDRNSNGEFGQIRSEGDGISGGKLQRPLSGIGEIRDAGRKNEGSGRRSKPDDGDTGEKLSGKQSAAESGFHNGDMESEGAGKDAGGGNRNGGSCKEVPLKAGKAEEHHKKLEKETNGELETMDTIGTGGEGSYEQASFSFAQNGEITIPEKYIYARPKKEPVVPHDYVRQVLLGGSGFSHRKERIYKVFADISDEKERAKQIKKEYGQGGAGWPVNGYGLHGYDTYHGNGLRFQWRDEEGEKEGYLNWKAVEREISMLILAGEYYQPPDIIGPDKSIPEKKSERDEKLWQEALKRYFNEESQYICVKTLIYDIFTTNLDMEEKAGFLAEIYGEAREGFSMAEKTDGLYGECQIKRDTEGITVSYVKEDGTRGEHKADYAYCAAFIQHMIEENEYLGDGIYEHFQETPQSFAAMPWFMEIYHGYKERMASEPDFAPIELTETVEAQTDNRTFPDALHQVEGMEEDLRETLEIYMKDCSCIHPYRPFLQMMHESSLPKEDKLYFLNEAINSLGDGEEIRTYHNNAYHLVEYIQNRDSFTVNFKNGEGERKKVPVTYEQLYSVMEYLIQAELFTEKEQQAEYVKEFQQKEREKKSILEKKFEDKLIRYGSKVFPGNFRLEEELLRENFSEERKAGQKTRYRWNVESIRLLKEIEGEERPATREEQRILAKYVGWGGIPQAFDEKNSSWRREFLELKSLLSEGEYENARDSVNTAFYTDPMIAGAVYKALKKFGFKGGSILDESVA